MNIGATHSIRLTNLIDDYSGVFSCFFFIVCLSLICSHVFHSLACSFFNGFLFCKLWNDQCSSVILLSSCQMSCSLFLSKSLIHGSIINPNYNFILEWQCVCASVCAYIMIATRSIESIKTRTNSRMFSAYHFWEYDTVLHVNAYGTNKMRVMHSKCENRITYGLHFFVASTVIFEFYFSFSAHQYYFMYWRSKQNKNSHMECQITRVQKNNINANSNKLIDCLWSHVVDHSNNF